MKTEKLTEEGYELILKGREQEFLLNSRVFYIAEFITNAFNGDDFFIEYSNAYADHDGNYDEGCFDYKDNSENVQVNIFLNFKRNIDLNCYISNKLYNLRNGFPRRWLFEDFEEELKIGIENYKNNAKK